MAAHGGDVCIMKSCLHEKALIHCDVYDSDDEDADTIDVYVHMLTTKF